MPRKDAQVVVIGAGITGLACAHRLAFRGVDCLLLEAGSRVGGKIHTLRGGGYQFEAGPNTLMTSRPDLPALIDELGLADQVVEAAPEAKRRYIATGGRLHPLPMNPLAMLKSPLVGFRGAAAAAGDLWHTSTGAEDESVAAFIRRRLGDRMLDNLVGPFLNGVYAGDPERLEAASVLKPLVQAERTHGSIIRGMIRQRKAARKAGTAQKLRSITFLGGLDVLPEALARALGERLRLSAPVHWIEETGDGLVLGLEDGELIRCDHLILASPGKQTAHLVQHLPGGEALARGIAQVPMASLAVVGLAYPRPAISHPLDGFGYLAGPASASPGTTGPVLGCLFRSTIFPHAAPAGKALLTAFLGGVRHPEITDMSDQELINTARCDLAAMLGIAGNPEHAFIRRWNDSIPQYERGHAALAAGISRWSAQRPVSIIGNALTGISMPDCIAAARLEADRVAQRSPIAHMNQGRELQCA